MAGIDGGGRVLMAAAGWLFAFTCAAAEAVAPPSVTPPPAPASTPVPAATPLPPVDPLAGGSVLNVIFSLMLVIGAIWGVAWLMRRLSLFHAPAGGAMRMLGGLAVGQRERVVLVQVGETQLLLGVAPGRVQTLHVLDKPIEVAAPGEGEGFAERLAQVMGRGGEK